MTGSQLEQLDIELAKLHTQQHGLHTQQHGLLQHRQDVSIKQQYYKDWLINREVDTVWQYTKDEILLLKQWSEVQSVCVQSVCVQGSSEQGTQSCRAWGGVGSNWLRHAHLNNKPCQWPVHDQIHSLS